MPCWISVPWQIRWISESPEEGKIKIHQTTISECKIKLLLDCFAVFTVPGLIQIICIFDLPLVWCCQVYIDGGLLFNLPFKLVCIKRDLTSHQTLMPQTKISNWQWYPKRCYPTTICSHLKWNLTKKNIFLYFSIF